jgi:hypothetical protein
LGVGVLGFTWLFWGLLGELVVTRGGRVGRYSGPLLNHPAKKHLPPPPTFASTLLDSSRSQAAVLTSAIPVSDSADMGMRQSEGSAPLARAASDAMPCGGGCFSGGGVELSA